MTKFPGRASHPAAKKGAAPSRGETSPGPNVLAVLFPLSPSELGGLTEELAPDWAVADGRRVLRPDAVLLPPCSRQAIAAVRATYPNALLIIVDSAPDGPRALGDGPVHRALAAGADAYAFDALRHAS